MEPVTDLQPFIISEGALILWWVSLGLGRHAAIVPIADLEKTGLIIFVGAFLYSAAVAFPKLSALFFYRRMFGACIYRSFHIALWGLVGLVTVWLLAAEMVSAQRSHKTILTCDLAEHSLPVLASAGCIRSKRQRQMFAAVVVDALISDNQ